MSNVSRQELSMSWNLLLSDRIDSLSPPAQFDAFADAHLESAARLCRVLVRSTQKATYERGMVVLYLVSHSIELFLKAAIARREPKERFNHDLKHIENRYKALYPGKRFALQIPFSTSYEGVPSDQIAAAKKLIASRDQRLRYPRNNDGDPWPGVHAFEANSFLKQITTLQSAYSRLRSEFETANRLLKNLDIFPTIAISSRPRDGDARQ
jgi:hypothetical protein